MNFFTKLLARRRTIYRVITVQRDPTRLRLDEWRKDPELVKVAAKLLLDSNLRLMLDVCRNESPAFTVQADGIPLDQRILHQARAEGYCMFLANLEALARTSQPDTHLESTFEEPETEPQP